MPIYEFQCEACHHCFEKICFGEDQKADAACPSCGSDKTQKLISCASFIGGSRVGLCAPNASKGFS